MFNTTKHGDLCRCPACCAGEPLRPNLEFVVPVLRPSRLGIMCCAAARWLRWSVSKVRLLARSVRFDRIRECRMPRWFHRRTALITWAGLATIGLTPIFVSSLIDGAPETVEQLEVRAELEPEPIEQLDVQADLEYRIDAAEHLVVVPVEVGSAEQVCKTGGRQRLRIAATASRAILRVARQVPNKVVVIHLRDVPLSFSSLPASDRRSLAQWFGQGAVRQYESSVARLLESMVHTVQSAQPRAAVSVLGLPIEPEEAGVSIEIARQSNERYGMVIDQLDSFVPGRSFIVFGTSRDEVRLARTGLREALRLRDGRPVVFQTNVAWRVLMDADGPGYRDYQIAGSTEQGIEMEASLSD